MRITKTLVGAAIAVGLLLAAAPVKAHHAFAAAFDDHKPINLQGTVTKVELVNPHSWLWLDVKGADQLGDRGRASDQPFPERHHQGQFADRHRDQTLRVSGEERRNQGCRGVR